MIGSKLNMILAERRLTRTKLSEMSGVSMPTLQALFRDDWQRVDRGTIDKIAKALGIKSIELFTEVEKQQDLFEEKRGEKLPK